MRRDWNREEEEMENKKWSLSGFSFKKVLTNESIGALLIWFVIVIVLSCVSGDTFLTLRNFTNLSRFTSFYVMVGLGVLMVFMGGNMDMSLGATMGMAGIVTAYLSKCGLPLPVIILAAVVVGVIIGGFNGYLIGYWQFPCFIATLGSKQLVRGLINVMTKGYPINELGESYVNMGTGSTLGIPNPVWITVILGMITWYVLNKTVFGRHLAATGGNDQAAIVSGINTRRIRMLSYIYAGVFAAIAGMVLTARMSVAQTATGEGFELEAIAGAIIGGASAAGGQGTVMGTIFGIMVIYTVKNGMSLLSVNAYWQMAVQGAVVLLAIFLDILRKRKK